MSSTEFTPEVERVHRPSRQEFEARFLAKQKPVIITGAMADWPALERWSDDYLKATAGARKLRISVAHEGHHFYDAKDKILDDVSMSLSEYVDLIAAGPNVDGRLYASIIPLWESLPELSGDIRLPPYFDPKGVAMPHMWFGAGSTSPLHYDSSHNFLTQVRGRKKVVLRAPRYIRDLYPFPFHYAAAHVSHVNVNEVDHVRFPKYDKVPTLTACLEPGDMLFIPLFWWHAVFGIGPNISVNFWWTTPVSDYLRYPYQSLRGLSNLAVMELRKAMKKVRQRRETPPRGVDVGARSS